jgi:hypothetical protein
MDIFSSCRIKGELAVKLLWRAGMNFFRVLLDPESEETEYPDRKLVGSAANLLQVGEFQLLQLAYRQWFGEDLPEAQISRLFTSYMMRHEVPSWARHYARSILELHGRGQLDARNPAYHRYDNDYVRQLPTGLIRFLLATALVAFVMLASILAASTVKKDVTSILPPYFERKELRPASPIERQEVIRSER